MRAATGPGNEGTRTKGERLEGMIGGKDGRAQRGTRPSTQSATL